MTANKKFSKKVISVILVMAMLMTYIPLSMFSVSAADTGITLTADPSTMGDWKKYFGDTTDLNGVFSTENAGGVWTDKSVIADLMSSDDAIKALRDAGITKADDSLLVALSAISSNMTVTGMSRVPTDTMLVLDVSGSMNNNTGNNDVAEELVEAANASIQTLLGTNNYSRVGVVLYSGTTRSNNNNATAAQVLLPLGRYTTETDGEYVNYVLSGSDEYVRVDPDVVYEGTQNSPPYVIKEVSGATYIQKGLDLALTQFEKSDIVVNDPIIGTVKRMPVVVLMSDGSPTLGTTNFSNANGSDVNYNLGVGNTTDDGYRYYAAPLGFTTQLTAAYVKHEIETHYNNDCLFYTLGLGVSNDPIATSVLDPENSNAAINEFWRQYNEDIAVDKTLTVYSRYGSTARVTKIETPLDQKYVDEYFNADTYGTDLAQGLKDAFADIVGKIQLQSKYFPTLVTESEELSGYISFVDKIGQFLKVTEVEGIMIHNSLFSGADFASGVTGGAFGTTQNPTTIGDNFVWSIMDRLGIATAEEVRTLIGLAYEQGQLSYTDADNFSNYIGWYSNAAGEFLGFWYDGITTMPDPNDASLNDATRPVYINKSYFYLGEVSEEQGVSKSDMMYATVRVRERIDNGEQSVAFAIPAALIPIVTYNVTVDGEGTLTDMQVTGATAPIQLIYEVALRKDINKYTVNDILGSTEEGRAYLAANTDEDGNINFYSNQYDVNNKTGYTTVNTYSYFNPSRQNDRYYYTDDATVCYENGTAFTGSTHPKDYNGDLYRKLTNYVKNGNRFETEIKYRVLSSAARETAVEDGNGGYVIKKGNVHVNFADYVTEKTSNPTGTLTWSNQPFVDTDNHSINDTGYNFIVGATLGNNGRITLTPETGIKISKAMSAGVTANAPFEFTVTNTTDSGFNGTYTAYYLPAVGEAYETTVRFESGVATVNVGAGDAVYIGDLPAGDNFTVVETELVDYKLVSVNGDENAKFANITVADKAMADADFVNTSRGKGDLTVTKQVSHDFGTDYQLPDRAFKINVTLSGVGTKNAAFTAKYSSASAATQITTDGNGMFSVELKHYEQIEIFDLPEGTVATVVEPDPGKGFAITYFDNGFTGDGVVEVVADNVVSVIVGNDYTAEKVSPVNITVGGTKNLKELLSDGTLVDYAWQADYEFKFELQRRDTVEGNVVWTKVAESTVKGSDQSGQQIKDIVFPNGLENEVYDSIGTYYYRIVEVTPEGDMLGGFTYDTGIHAFSVQVTDTDMNGKLEISSVDSYRDSATVTTPADNTWHVNMDFVNTYAQNATDVTVDVNKVVVNPSESPNPSVAGFAFEVYEYTGSGNNVVLGKKVATSNPTTSSGATRIALNFTADGTYKYVIKEIPGNLAGWDYSTELHFITVVVTDDYAGNLTAKVYADALGEATAALNITVKFTNTYAPDAVEVPLNFIRKELSSTTARPQNAGEFKFNISGKNYTLSIDGKNDANGNIIFDKNLKFDKVGLYHHDITETFTDVNGVTYDTNTYRLAVTVTDDYQNGKLKAEYVVLNTQSNEIVFKNSYKADPVTNVIKGQKFLKGKTLLNDEFTFVLTEATNAAGNIATGARTWETKNLIDGTFAFEAQQYTEPGVYYYVVSEKTATGDTYGIIYDTVKYVVTVTVVDNFNTGKLEVRTPTYTILNNGPANAIVYNNEYKADKTSAAIPGTKVFEGKALGGDDFEFRLYQSDSAWTEGELLETVKNNAAGAFTFKSIDYTVAGSTYYLVNEVKGNKGGVTYDESVFRVRVDITDDLRGQLHSNILVFDENNIPQAGVEFVNKYTINGTDTVTLNGNKELDGRDIVDGEFTFELYEADDEFNIAEGTTPKTAVNTGSTFKFELTYNPEDVGNTYFYVAKEQKAGTTDKGVTYDSASYQITVEVTDNGDGTIKSIATVKKAGANATTLDFKNTYDAADTTVTFSGKKSIKLINGTRTLKADEFTFELYRTQADYDITGVNPQTVKNAANGEFTFTAETLTEATDYYFVIRESAATSVPGITFDTNQYRYKVTVADDGDGNLYVAGKTLTKFDGVDSVTATAVEFENKYNAAAVPVVFDGTKILKTPNSNRTLKADEFTFELYQTGSDFATAGIVAKTVKNAANGEFTFEAENLGEAKTYYFVIKEQKGSAEYITYDKNEYRYTVTVADDGEGNLYVAGKTLRRFDGTNSVAAEAVMFENTYTAKKTSVDFSGTKELDTPNTNRELAANDFTFEHYTTDSTFNTAGMAPITVKNKADNSFYFAPIILDEEKVYYYVIKEKNDGKSGVKYDANEYRYTVTVADDGNGNLYVADKKLEKYDGISSATATAVEFKNTYTAADTFVEFGGNKSIKLINGTREIKADEFTFEVYNATSAFALDGGYIEAVKNKADGSFKFSKIPLTEEKTYYFVIKENGTSPLAGFTYDVSQYRITVTVTDDGNGNLKASTPKIEKFDGVATTAETAIAFENKYEASKAELILKGKKELEGRDLEAGEFTFKLNEANSDFVIKEGVDAKTTVNKADKTFQFDTLSFTEVGTYYYVITEVETEAERVTFDDAIYNVTIVVTDNGEGKLVYATPTIEKVGATEPTTEIVFENVFTPKPTDINVEFKVDKTVENKGTDKIGPEGFKFVLEKVGGSKLNATTDKSGDAKFTLTFTEDDIGNTYTYKLSEVNEGKGYVTYSDKVYTVTVTITLNADNKLVATMTVDDLPVNSVTAAFVNVYDFTPEAPVTGDARNLIPWIVMLTLSGFTALGAIFVKKRKANGR